MTWRCRTARTRSAGAAWRAISSLSRRSARPSENGASLDELIALGERVNDATKSMGMALSGCTPPAKGTPIFTLADNEMEMGVGIHGEPGRARKPFATANQIVDEIVEAI